MKETELDSYNKIIEYIKKISDNWHPDLKEECLKLIKNFRDWGGITHHFAGGFTDKSSFNEKLWEMLLARKLNESKLKFNITTGEGPDFFLPDLNLWIEAIAPKPKDLPQNYLDPIEVWKPGKKIKPAIEVPHDKILLNWTSAIKEKIEKLTKYVKKGIVKNNHGYIIAVNGCQLGTIPTLKGQSMWPIPAEIGYGIGPSTASFSKDPQVETIVFNPYRNNIFNNNNANVNTDILFDSNNTHLTAIMGTTVGVNEILMRDRDAFVMAHNFFAKNPIHCGLLAGMQDYIVRHIGGDNYEVLLVCTHNKTI